MWVVMVRRSIVLRPVGLLRLNQTCHGWCGELRWIVVEAADRRWILHRGYLLQVGIGHS